MDAAIKRGFLFAHDPNSYMMRSERRGNYRPRRRRRRPPVLYAIITFIMLAVLYPVGMIMLWRRKLKWPAAVKALLSVLFAAVFALGCAYVYHLDAVRPYADDLIGRVRQVFQIDDGGSPDNPGIVTATGTPTDAGDATDAPTDAPTQAPSDAPTDKPTDEPTEAPTDAPTEDPEVLSQNMATEAPTDEPTEAPTDEPTEAPTDEPTEAPTEAPTPAPTFDAQAVVAWPGTAGSGPSNAILSDIYEVLAQRQYPLLPSPSPEPTPTLAPTDEPTEAPAAEPTETPTTAFTGQPTIRPTATPRPTEQPTATARPTEQFTAQPTATPIATPETVYHTRTGSRFHLMPDCGRTEGASPDTWANSVAGGYKPCPDCVGKEYPEAVAALSGATPASTTAPTPTAFIPANPSGVVVRPETVYHTETGSRFHLMPDCGLTRGADPDTWEHAVAGGYKPCPDCVGKEYPAAVAALDDSVDSNALVFIPNTPTPMPEGTFIPGITPSPTDAQPTTEAQPAPDAQPAPAAQPATEVPAAQPTALAATEANTFVYYDAQNGIYHVIENCPRMATGVATTLADAVARGAVACPDCAAEDAGLPRFVYHEVDGKYYHADAECARLQNAVVETAEEAYAHGERPCPDCQPQPLDELLPAGGDGLGPMVYTGGGKYYHAGSVCGAMKSGQPISREEAIARGQTECPYCHPDATPTPAPSFDAHDQETVYYANGKYYHKSSVCGAMTNGQPMMRGEAKAAGAQECPYCHPDATPTPHPTATPTPEPTEAPTPEPTEAPTPEPTEAPKPEPTEATTADPAGGPTQIPTIEPRWTEAPTAGATEQALPTLTPEASQAPLPTPYYDPEKGLQLEQEYVYMSESGKYYHRGGTCAGEGDAQLVRVLRQVALGLGLTDCPECRPNDELALPYAIVYHAEGDEYFHSRETCEQLALDSTLMLLSDAVIEGQLPCPYCVTELPEAVPTITPDGDAAGVVRWVYRTLTGQYYHSRATCSGIYSPYLVTLQDAEDAGLAPCPYCEGDGQASGEN